MARDQDATGDGAAEAGLTRGQVAQRLGVAVATVRRLEGKRLHPRMEGGAWIFDPREVAEVANERAADAPAGRARQASAGAVAAAVFRLLDVGTTFREIVRLTEQPPDVVRALYREWRCGFSVPPEGDDDDDLERARDRDERELRAWEQQMIELGRREDEYDRRPRRDRLRCRSLGRRSGA